MKITLVYNPQAGGTSLPLEDLVKGLEKRGAEVFVQNTKEEDYEQALEQPCDFMIIAGGDGTIGKIAGKVMALGKNIPFALLPFGNANNIAGSLEVDMALGSMVASWQQKDFRDFTVGSIDLGGSSKWFFESVGWGLFAEVLLEVKAEKKAATQSPTVKQDKVKYGLQKLSQIVQELQPAFYQIFLDKEDYSGYYLWVEVMNTQSMGPQLQLAPDAEHGDRYLDVVMIKENEKGQLENFLNNQDGENTENTFNPIKARHIKIRSQQPIHIDDKLYQMDDPGDQWMEIRLLPQPIQILNA
jgi:diacylglycerol kinase (ATP)